MKTKTAGTIVTLNLPMDQGWALYRIVAPGLAGSMMIIASLLPWLTYPTGEHFLSWQLPVDIGWQVRLGMVNYGLLCLGCACYVLFVTYKAWQTRLQIGQYAALYTRPFVTTPPLIGSMGMAALLCLLPTSLFLLQYLFIDMQSVAVLTRSELQLLLVKVHLGYGVADQFFHIQSLSFQPLHFKARLGLILDHTSIGLFLPLGSSLILLSEHILSKSKITQPAQSKGDKHSFYTMLAVALSLITILVLGRGPAGLLCVYEAEHLTSTGNYNAALQWLDTAHLLNPTLDQLAAYHVERGQAWYFLHPQQLNLESQVYLAAYYRQQNDLLSSYQELADARQKYPRTPWLTDEMSLSLERLAELSKPLAGQQIDLLDDDTSALPWLHQLEQIDPMNIYAHYAIGRILYDMRDYSACEAQMRSILALDTLNDVQSSAYTYMALSEIGQGNAATGREYLFEAQNLDPEYRNNTARQNMSGMR